MNRVVITGVGAISCLGCDCETIAAGLYDGDCGIVIDAERQKLGFRSSLTGMIKGFIPQKYVSRKEGKTMTVFAVQSYAAAMQAIEQSGLDKSDLANEHTGLIFGCDSSSQAAYEQGCLTMETQDTGCLDSGRIFKSMISNVTMNLNVLLKTRGACWSISSACSSSGHAVGQGADLIRCGKQDVVICGGAQEINWHSMCSFDSLGALSVHHEDPTKASRPFSRDRDGLVPSGGAAVLMLENYDKARARGATILGEILGYGFSSDGLSISVPDKNGMCRSINMAIKESGIKSQSIDYFCAHATSTPAGDGVEAEAISEVFGDYKPVVSSLKGMTGHELWMAGAGQVVYTTLMAQRGFTAANINFSAPDESSQKLNILTERKDEPPRVALCNSAGFGGTNASLVIKYEV